MNKDDLSKSEKRKLELIQKKQRNKKFMMIATFIFIAIIAVILVSSMGLFNNADEENNTFSESNSISNTEISIPISSIESQASYYSYDSNGVEVKYFAVLDDGGIIHVATDACNLCYDAKQGYQQEGEEMKCRNCGLTFPIVDIGDKNTGGGCWPSYIPIQIEGDEVIIQKSDLDSKRFMFE